MTLFKVIQFYMLKIFVFLGTIGATMVAQIFDGFQQTLRSANSSRTAQNHGFQRVCGFVAGFPASLR